MTGPAEARQIPLALAPHTSYAREAFLPAACNRIGLQRVLAWRNWGSGKLVLSGPPASGKTHLAHVWAIQAGAAIVPPDRLEDVDPARLAAGVAVDDADRVAGVAAAERALLHLHNTLQQDGRPLLLTSRKEPGRWGVELPDLASRVTAAPHARLEPPDDALLAAVIVKLFDDRQLRVPPRLVAWLVNRMDRSLEMAQTVVSKLDAAALAEGGPVTRTLAEAVLDKLQDQQP